MCSLTNTCIEREFLFQTSSFLYACTCTVVIVQYEGKYCIIQCPAVLVSKFVCPGSRCEVDRKISRLAGINKINKMEVGMRLRLRCIMIFTALLTRLVWAEQRFSTLLSLDLCQGLSYSFGKQAVCVQGKRIFSIAVGEIYYFPLLSYKVE